MSAIEKIGENRGQKIGSDSDLFANVIRNDLMAEVVRHPYPLYPHLRSHVPTGTRLRLGDGGDADGEFDERAGVVADMTMKRPPRRWRSPAVARRSSAGRNRRLRLDLVGDGVVDRVDLGLQDTDLGRGTSAVGRAHRAARSRRRTTRDWRTVCRFSMSFMAASSAGWIAPLLFQIILGLALIHTLN